MGAAPLSKNLAFGFLDMIKTHVIESWIRRLRNIILYNYNFRFGREYIPDPRLRISIETSSICNLRCRFCAYTKKTSPKLIMPDELFRDCVKQAADLGFSHVGLTPMTGDVFCDPHLFDKLDFLESFEPIKEYSFFSNFTLPTQVDLEKLLALKKLCSLTVSIYGHDLNSFTAITGRGEGAYRRLIENMEYLIANISRATWRADVGWRSYSRLMLKPAPELAEIFRKCKNVGVKVARSQVYNNWGGFVGKEDVGELPIDINENDSVYKLGPCYMLFSSVHILADGTVNACSCRDVNGTLRIGNVKSTPLADIISAANPVYRGLIEAQKRGEFPEVCTNCDFYKSIYSPNKSLVGPDGVAVTLREFVAKYQ